MDKYSVYAVLAVFGKRFDNPAQKTTLKISNYRTAF